MRYSKGRALGGGIFDNKEIPDILYTFKLGKGVVIKLHFLDPEAIFYYSFPLEHTPRVLLPVLVFFGWMAQFFILFAFHQSFPFTQVFDSFSHAPLVHFLVYIY